jgi:hypothetical protein
MLRRLPLAVSSITRSLHADEDSKESERRFVANKRDIVIVLRMCACDPLNGA